MISTIIGLLVMITDELMVDVILSPLKNNSWLIATPKRAQAIKRMKSLPYLIFSATKKRSNAQNAIVAMITRIKINPNGPIYSGIAILEIL
jgi:hypothetical protein